MKGDALVSSLWALWNTQESLLQDYRSIFISSESILLSLSVAVLSLGEPFFAIILTIPGIFIHSLWRAICTARGRDVTFSQRLIEKVELGDIKELDVLCEFKRYQKEFHSKKGYILNDWCLNDDETFKEMQRSKTRVKMDKYLPNTYFILWLLVIVIFLYQIIKT